MIKLKCTSCGAELKVEDNEEYAVCEHCGSRYKVNEHVNVNIKLDDNVKDVINNGLETSKHFSKFLIIPGVIILVIIICSFAFAFKTSSDFNKRADEARKEIMENYNDSKNENDNAAEKSQFNFDFINANGTNYGIFVSSIIDNIISSNKTNDRKISLKYDNKSTTVESEIIEIKRQIVSTDEYEISVNYDDDGYVNEIVIEKIA